MLEEEVLILCAQKFDFENDNGEKVKGLSVYVIPFNQDKNEYFNGLKPVKYSLSSEKMNVFDGVSLPAYAKMLFKIDFSRNKIVPDTFKVTEEIELGLING